MNFWWQSVLVFIVAATEPAKKSDSDITVDCGNSSIRVTWRINQQWESSRIFLGTCLPIRVTELPGGSWEATFNVVLNDCLIKREVTGRWLDYMTDLTYRPYMKPKPPLVSHPVKCRYKRPDQMSMPVASPARGSAHGQGTLLFFMELMNDDFSGPAESTTFPLGSFIPIRAGVLQQAHMPLLLLLDECVAATTPELDPSSQVYPIISNGGCLMDSKNGSSRFLPRYRSSELHLFLQAFKFTLGEDVYIHCNLVAWDPQNPDTSKKACHYSKELGGWELLDDPSKNALCMCCDAECKYRKRREADYGSQGVVQKAMLGPVTILQSSQQLENSQCIKSLDRQG